MTAFIRVPLMMSITIWMRIKMWMNMMNKMMHRLDQQKEKELVAAYSNAGNPVSQFVNCVLIFVMCLLELSSKKTL